MKAIAQNDKWKGIRQDAISFLGDYAKGTEADLKTLLLNIAIAMLKQRCVLKPSML